MNVKYVDNVLTGEKINKRNQNVRKMKEYGS